MSQNGKIIPQLSQQVTNDSNLTVLQRIDCHVEEILATAGHVTLYDFNMELSQWSRKDVEGPLFVVKRRTQPRFQFIVMNRRSAENLVEDLLSDFEYEINLPYLLYRNANQEVIGIWFYDPRECDEVVKLFSRILNAFSKVPPKPKVFTNQSNEFQELESVPTSATIEGPLEPPSSTSAITEASEEPLERFFSASLHLSNRPELSSSTSVRSSTMTHPLPARSTSVSSTTLTPMPVSSPPLPASSVSLVHMAARPLDVTEVSSSSHATLVKPSFFVPQPSLSTSMPLSLSNAPMAPPLNPLPPLQPSYGAPLLQPFPPPAPSQSLAPASTVSQGPIITRDKVRDTLARLVQDCSQWWLSGSVKVGHCYCPHQGFLSTRCPALVIELVLVKMVGDRGKSRRLWWNRSPTHGFLADGALVVECYKVASLHTCCIGIRETSVKKIGDCKSNKRF